MKTLRPLLICVCTLCLFAGVWLAISVGRTRRGHGLLETAAGALIAAALVLLGITIRLAP